MFKKILLAALVVTSAVFAQVNVGGRAAFNFGSVWGENTDNANWGAGFNAGVDVKYNVSPVLSLISGLELDYRRMSDEYDNGYYTVEKAITFMYLDVPVLLRINASPTFFLDAGLTLGFNLSANQTREVKGASKSQDISSEVE
ncbi:MAG: PorT family protein, partial [Bacteroidales bacterium]|nr:PorT family protein [Bacteroidales bacterium]